MTECVGLTGPGRHLAMVILPEPRCPVFFVIISAE